MSNKHKILLIEDESNIANFVKTILEAEEYKVIVAGSGNEGKSLFSSHCPKIIILDLGLPDIDGIELIKTIREESDVPIIVLSARTNEKDKIQALDFGANDYVTKPFGTGELLARVRATIRNSRHVEGGGGVLKTKFILQDLVIDYEARQIFIKGNEIKLTQTEFNIVELLSVHAGKVMTYSEIVKKIWGYSDSGSIKKLQVNMANIRKKLGEKPGENKYIVNELSVGYRMINEES